MSTVRYAYRCPECRERTEHPHFDANLICPSCECPLLRVYTAPNLTRAAVPTRRNR